ncbi:MAG: PDDEXK nuclease domain-containing protein [Parachlamydiales bacterium]|nr:PDDEXK nuclease domain-containing protein [Parachlamydiales bacterium]
MPSNTIEKVQATVLKEYKAFFKEIKEKILTSQVKAALAVNHELINLYWEIGFKIHLKQKDEGWGAKTVENLAKDLKATFPEMKGFSHRNLKYMVQFAKEYPEFAIGQQLVAQIPWGHNILLLQKLETLQDRLWYAHKTIEHGWSRNVLLHWLDSGLHKREGKALTNFQITLPSPQSDLAHQTLKDPYCFDFLTLRDKHDEQELESGLLDHVQRFLLELGAGFSLVGRQVHLEVGGQDFYIDLLFYHYKLRCFIVVELKATDFKPEFVGKMNFYLSAVDDKMRHPDDKSTIGLLLCKGKNKVVAEYALRDVNKPIGISQYEAKIIESLPDELKGSLPSIEEIEQELEDRE